MRLPNHQSDGTPTGEGCRVVPMKKGRADGPCQAPADAAAPGAFGGIKGIVGLLEQTTGVREILRERRTSQADGQFSFGLAVDIQEGLFLDHGADLFCNLQRSALAGLRQKYQKLLAAIPGDNIRFTHMDSQKFGDLLQDHIALGMAVRVVVVLEVINGLNSCRMPAGMLNGKAGGIGREKRRKWPLLLFRHP